MPSEPFLTPLSAQRWPYSSEQPPHQHLDCLPFAGVEVGQPCRRELRLRQHQKCLLGLEPSMPTNGCPFKLLRFLPGEEVEIGERVLERHVVVVASLPILSLNIARVARGEWRQHRVAHLS